VLIRSAFPGRREQITLFRCFLEAIGVLHTYPSVADVCATFATAGIAYVALEPVPQVSADSLKTAADQLCRDAHTPLKLPTDAEYEAGLARFHATADTDSETGPVVDPPLTCSSCARWSDGTGRDGQACGVPEPT